MNLYRRFMDYKSSHGLSYTLRRSAEKAGQIFLGTYDRVRKKEAPTEEILSYQRLHQPDAGLLSVVVPVYNTRAVFLRDLLSSLRAQTYLNWETILYDGGSTLPETLQTLKEAETESRFRIVHSGTNAGISGNTNAAIDLAKGEYIVLCDHDDVLREDALWRVATAICDHHPDWIYSDEDMMTENGRRHMDPHYKPEFCPEYLLGDNYISHLGVLKKDLILRAGGLRPGFDGSQDHDLYLRCAALDPEVVHLPYVLYTWRKVRSSESRRHLDRCLDASARAAAEADGCVAVPVGPRIRIWPKYPKDASVDAVIFSSEEDACRACYADLLACSPWPNLTGTLAVTDLEKLYATLNEAAASSTADYLLFLDAAVVPETRHFFREMLGWACREGVAGVTPMLTDRRGKITHSGYALGGEKIARCRDLGLYKTTGGWHDKCNKVHNVSAVSPCCLLVRRDRFIPWDENYKSGLAAADQGVQAIRLGMRFVFTPHASLLCEEQDLLLRGKDRYQPDVNLFISKYGTDLRDPYDPEKNNR